MTTRLLIATTNTNKVREIRQLLAGAPLSLVTLAGWPDVAAPEETGRTFEENARVKALYYAAATGELTVATRWTEHPASSRRDSAAAIFRIRRSSP
jgi:inosine/xanthosine triphosphate pyrophosphatase family protein